MIKKTDVFEDLENDPDPAVTVMIWNDGSTSLQIHGQGRILAFTVEGRKALRKALKRHK